MKFKFVSLFVFIVMLAVLTACTATPQGSLAVQLPEDLIKVLGMLVLVGFMYLFKWLGSKIGIDLSGHAAEIATAVTSVLVLVINWALGLIPAAYDNVISAFFAFLIVFLGGAGFYSLFLRKKNR